MPKGLMGIEAYTKKAYGKKYERAGAADKKSMRQELRPQWNVGVVKFYLKRR